MKPSKIVEHLEVQLGIVATVKGRAKNKKFNRPRGFVVFLDHKDAEQTEAVRRAVYDLVMEHNVTALIEIVVEDAPEGNKEGEPEEAELEVEAA